MTNKPDEIRKLPKSKEEIEKTMSILNSLEFSEIIEVLDQLKDPVLKKLLKSTALEFYNK